MEEIITYQSYSEYKAELDTELQKSAEGFVRIGYLLKLARDTDVLKESGYASVNEFAQAEYNIDKSMVSRFIGINDRFSEGGNSPQLKEHYRSFGYAKLAIMLQLPDSINEELSPAFSKSEIQAVKEEYDSEMKKTDLEVLMEEKPEGQTDMSDDLSKAVRQLGHDNPELYKDIYWAAVKAGGGYKALQEALAPAGEGICSIRIPGMGRMLLSIKGTDSEITLTNIRTGEKKGYSWESLHGAVCRIARLDSKNPEESWEKVYEEPFPVEKEPEKPEVAPVQQKKEDKKPKKQPKVIKAKAEEKPVNTRSKEPEKKEEVQSREEETIVKPGLSYPEACQAAESGGSETGTIKNITEIAEIVTETPMDVAEQGKSVRGEVSLKPHMALEKFQIRRQEYVDNIMSVIAGAKEYMENDSCLMAKSEMEKGIDLINKLFKLEQENIQYMVKLKKKREDELDKEDDEDADE